VHRWLLVVALVGCVKKQTVATTPSNAVKLEIERAEQAEQKREHEVARTHYEAAIALATDPRSAAFARREFAETLATWGELEAARDQLEQAVAATPADPIAWQMLGIVRASDAIKDLPGAFAALERSKQLAPHAWIPRRDLAVLHWKLGHRAEALAEYRAMLELDLPQRLRDKVQWAIGELSRPAPPPSP
jgi:tetratricopeptide (TPR) repeat protein